MARFDHLTNAGAGRRLQGPGAGVQIDKANDARDTYKGCDKARVNASHSMVQTRYRRNGLAVTFGEGIVAPVDPRLADPANGNFHLKSTAGRWTPTGCVRDAVMSPAIGKGYSSGAPGQNPERASDRNELGAYGNSGEALYVR